MPHGCCREPSRRPTFQDFSAVCFGSGGVRPVALEKFWIPGFCLSHDSQCWPSLYNFFFDQCFISFGQVSAVFLLFASASCDFSLFGFGSCFSLFAFFVFDLLACIACVLAFPFRLVSPVCTFCFGTFLPYKAFLTFAISVDLVCFFFVSFILSFYLRCFAFCIEALLPVSFCFGWCLFLVLLSYLCFLLPSFLPSLPFVICFYCFLDLLRFPSIPVDAAPCRVSASSNNHKDVGVVLLGFTNRASFVPAPSM